MMTQVKNTDKIIEEYIKINPPYHSSDRLGINVSAVMNYAKKAGKKVKDLTKAEVSMFSN